MKKSNERNMGKHNDRYAWKYHLNDCFMYRFLMGISLIKTHHRLATRVEKPLRLQV